MYSSPIVEKQKLQQIFRFILSQNVLLQTISDNNCCLLSFLYPLAHNYLRSCFEYFSFSYTCIVIHVM